MSSFPGSPRLLRGGLVQVDPESGSVLGTIALQFNPDTLTRTLQVQATGETGDRSQALRLRGAAVETIKLEAEIDATDTADDPDANPDAVRLGIHPQPQRLRAVARLPGCLHLQRARERVGVELQRDRAQHRSRLGVDLDEAAPEQTRRSREAAHGKLPSSGCSYVGAPSRRCTFSTYFRRIESSLSSSTVMVGSFAFDLRSSTL